MRTIPSILQINFFDSFEPFYFRFVFSLFYFHYKRIKTVYEIINI